MSLSVIVPAFDCARYLGLALPRLLQELSPEDELIVVNDGNSLEVSQLVSEFPVRLVATERVRGPAFARNLGAKTATGSVLVFVDADVLIAPGALNKIREELSDLNMGTSAVFGSYDASPTAENFLSQFRNLFHHFVHQNSCEKASTFWSGLGAIRCQAFRQLGGFSTRFQEASIEDIELGYRLKQRGMSVKLCKDIQGSHLKHWTLGTLVRTDFFCRALPWLRLIGERDSVLVNDLNLTWKDRFCTLFLLIAFFSSFFSLFGLALAFLSAFTVLCFPVLNFFRRERGVRFAVGSWGMLVMHYGICFSAVAYFLVERSLGSRGEEYGKAQAGSINVVSS